MARNKFISMLHRPDKGMAATHGSSGVLSRLFRKMLIDLNVTPMKFSGLLADYVRDSKNKVPDNRRDISSVQGNLTKELSRPDMTWKVFCKGVKFLQFTKFEICLKCYRNNSENSAYTVHSISVDLHREENDVE